MSWTAGFPSGRHHRSAGSLRVAAALILGLLVLALLGGGLGIDALPVLLVSLALVALLGFLGAPAPAPRILSLRFRPRSTSPPARA